MQAPELNSRNGEENNSAIIIMEKIFSLILLKLSTAENPNKKI